MGNLALSALRLVLALCFAGTLFVQVVARDVEATHLRAELDEVI